jgi:ABC-type oligopeptide transport system substrate-binding subunit
MPRLNISFAVLFGIFLGFSSFAETLPPPILRFAIEDEPSTFDWHNSRPRLDRFMNSFLMRSLLGYGGADGTSLVCDLCKSYQVSPDGKTLSFELNTSDKWSDGVSLEAKHFVDSFKRLTDPKKKFPAAEDFAGIDSVTAQDQFHFTISLKKSSKFFLHLLSTLSANPIRKEFKDDFESHVTKAVIGPYYLAAHEAGKRIVVEANPNFVGTLPVQRVDFVMGNHSGHIKRFKAGKIDVFGGPTTDDIMQVPNKKVQVNPYWATRVLLFNMKRKPFDELSLRKAVLFALDRGALPGFMGNGERKVTGLVPPGLKGYRELPLHTADLERAKQELARVPKIEKLKIKLLTNDSETSIRMTGWIKEQLSRVKIQLEVTVQPGKHYFESLEKGNFDIALSTLALATATPLDALRAFKTKSRNNYGKWTNVVYDELVEQLFEDEEHRSEYELKIDQATQILESQMVGMIPLTYPVRSYLLGTRIESFTLDNFADPVWSKIKLKN